MLKSENTIIKNDLILIGGGHAHLMLMMEYGKKPIPNTRITLISNELDTPYSGMIPGYIEGIYSWREAHIDLYKLSMKLNIRFIHSEVINISGKNKKVYLKKRPSLSYDFLSINSGIQSDFSRIKGAKKYSLPVKPISKLASNFLKEVDNYNSIAFIGGGAGAVELALALRKRFKNKKSTLKITIVTGESGLLKSFSKKTQTLTHSSLDNANINVIEKKYILEITKYGLITSDNKSIKVDKCILSTNAMAPEWLQNTDINLNEKGFIKVNKSFQTNFEFIFAAGDIIDFNKMNLDKAGVYAVRAGKHLAKSIKRFILNKPMYFYKFDKNYLALIGLANGYAIASKYSLSNCLKINHHLKKYIDKRFIKKFNNFENITLYSKLKKIILYFLNKITKNSIFILNDEIQMQCKGCAAKVPFNALKKSLPKNLTFSSEDASSIPQHPSLFQTIDMINAIITDPFLLGKISANHSLSDIYAVKSKAISAQMILQLPLSKPEINSRDLRQVSLGAQSIFESNECILNGGHTMIGNDADPVIGFSVTGEKKNISSKVTTKIKPGDILILTGKIGSGLIFAGINNNFIDSYYQIDVINQMIEGNTKFANIIEKLTILSMTDITGFGLANHLLNLIQRDSNNTGLTLNIDKIPIYKGVKKALEKGVKSSLFNSNFEAANKNIIYENDKKLIDEIIYDPQTVGGLGFIICKQNKIETFKVLKQYKIEYSVIGFVNNIKNKIKIE